jgi:protein-S-isoprenylcysteine O-methyltransferase Ste14
MAGIGNFARYRIAFSRLVALGLLAALLFSDLPVWQDPLLTRILYWIGFVLMMVCALGRLWSLQYLSGYKTRTIVESGPFSVVRNPLYLFSFLGALGAPIIPL